MSNFVICTSIITLARVGLGALWLDNGDKRMKGKKQQNRFEPTPVGGSLLVIWFRV